MEIRSVHYVITFLLLLPVQHQVLTTYIYCRSLKSFKDAYGRCADWQGRIQEVNSELLRQQQISHLDVDSKHFWNPTYTTLGKWIEFVGCESKGETAQKDLIGERTISECQQNCTTGNYFAINGLKCICNATTGNVYINSTCFHNQNHTKWSLNTGENIAFFSILQSSSLPKNKRKQCAVYICKNLQFTIEPANCSERNLIHCENRKALKNGTFFEALRICEDNTNIAHGAECFVNGERSWTPYFRLPYETQNDPTYHEVVTCSSVFMNNISEIRLLQRSDCSTSKQSFICYTDSSKFNVDNETTRKTINLKCNGIFLNISKPLISTIPTTTIYREYEVSFTESSQNRIGHTQDFTTETNNTFSTSGTGNIYPKRTRISYLRYENQSPKIASLGIHSLSNVKGTRTTKELFTPAFTSQSTHSNVKAESNEDKNNITGVIIGVASGVFVLFLLILLALLIIKKRRFRQKEGENFVLSTMTTSPPVSSATSFSTNENQVVDLYATVNKEETKTKPIISSTSNFGANENPIGDLYATVNKEKTKTGTLELKNTSENRNQLNNEEEYDKNTSENRNQLIKEEEYDKLSYRKNVTSSKLELNVNIYDHTLSGENRISNIYDSAIGDDGRKMDNTYDHT